MAALGVGARKTLARWPANDSNWNNIPSFKLSLDFRNCDLAKIDLCGRLGRTVCVMRSNRCGIKVGRKCDIETSLGKPQI